MSEQTSSPRSTAVERAGDLSYDLPQELIAQRPLPKRDASRLLVVDRESDALLDERIASLPGLLQPGDLLVLNDAKVVPARFAARRRTGGVIEGLFLEERSPGEWLVMLRGSARLRAGEMLTVLAEHSGDLLLRLEESLGEGQWRVRTSGDQCAEDVLSRIGKTPLPPYIRRKNPSEAEEREDRARYQTVYARSPGAVAAPTAGLHLTDDMLQAIRAAGVEVAFVTLYVGIGTFKPISVDALSEHDMHAERYSVSEETSEAIRACRSRGGRVVAVGTTSVRALESSSCADDPRLAAPGRRSTNLFIRPPYRFRVVDVLLTNFHLPRSTLLALVMAFAGVERTRRAYEHAIEQRYRFFSYGDAMFVC